MHFIQSHILSTQHGVQQLNKPLLWSSCKQFVLHKMWSFICHLNVNTKLMSLFRHSWEIVCCNGLPVSSLSSFLSTSTTTTVHRAVDMQRCICSHIWWWCVFHTNIDKFCCWSLVCLCITVAGILGSGVYVSIVANIDYPKVICHFNILILHNFSTLCTCLLLH